MSKKLLLNNIISDGGGGGDEWVWEDIPILTGSSQGKLITPIVLWNSSVKPVKENEILFEAEYKISRSTTGTPNISFYNSSAHNVSKSINLTGLTYVKDNMINIKCILTDIALGTFRVEYKLSTDTSWSSATLSMADYSAIAQFREGKELRIKKYFK